MQFKKEISFISKVFVDEQWVEQVVTKTGTFNALTRTNRDQHKIHFMLFSIMKSSGDDGEITVDSDQLYDITVKFIKTSLITGDPDGFTEQDKIEFLADGVALLSFGYWLLGDQITPFFTQLTMK